MPAAGSIRNGGWRSTSATIDGLRDAGHRRCSRRSLLGWARETTASPDRHPAPQPIIRLPNVSSMLAKLHLCRAINHDPAMASRAIQLSYGVAAPCCRMVGAMNLPYAQETIGRYISRLPGKCTS